MSLADILIVDDEDDIRALIQGILEDEGYVTRQAANSRQAYEQFTARRPALVILDIWLQNSEHDGLQILDHIRAADPHMPVLMISGHGTIETAVTAIKQGAYDFIEKPFKSDRLLLMIQRALEASHLKRENQALRQRGAETVDLIGASTHIAAVRQVLARVAPTHSRILITGEPGTGKDVVARVIHRMSDRAHMPFVTLNCANMNPERLEMELFGAEGATVHIGLLEQADGGTLLLDEVSDMPLGTQAKILRVLQDQRFHRVGGHEAIQVDVRIIASTNRDLEKAMENGHFRQDLYYRLNVVPVQMPPLRDRVQDIPLLAENFIGLYAKQLGVPGGRFSDGALLALQRYDWPGNVRQLKNVVEWVMIMGGSQAGQDMTVDDLPPEICNNGEAGTSSLNQSDLLALPLREARELFERDYLLAQISRFHGNISKTAQFVGMERSALHRKLKSLNVGMPEKENDLRKSA